jgi:hypothetical protein
MLERRDVNSLLHGQPLLFFLPVLVFLQLDAGELGRVLKGFGFGKIIDGFEEGEDVAGSLAGEAVIETLGNIYGKTFLVTAEGTLLQMLAFHGKAGLLGDHLEQVESRFYALKVIG